MSTSLPKVIHTYQNHHLDSTRWGRYRPRPDDIVITTSYRSGTTWLQEIVRRLLFWEREERDWRQIPLNDLSPWLDMRIMPLEQVCALLEGQQHRRFIKTHLALDGLPFYPEVSYIVVGRDPRDVFMSFLNHYSNLSDRLLDRLNETPDRVGPPLLPCPTDRHEVWRTWMTRGWFAWESEGYPYWGNLHHTQTWWNYRQLANILFVHYNDLLADLPSELRRIAGFLHIPVTDTLITEIVPDVSLTALRHMAEVHGAYTGLKGGPQAFFFKGTNGRWQEFLSAEELVLYEQTAARVLTLDCRRWLEHGSVAMRHTDDSHPTLQRIQKVAD
ncbi:MAG: sulfotransferase domain-containing protein [Caldilinea sp. CFX5]|nr:sulfotransferase domain-containing protein [Caldilinea sp. CFX5]